MQSLAEKIPEKILFCRASYLHSFKAWHLHKMAKQWNQKLLCSFNVELFTLTLVYIYSIHCSV
jgi:hypothetical protein